MNKIEIVNKIYLLAGSKKMYLNDQKFVKVVYAENIYWIYAKLVKINKEEVSFTYGKKNKKCKYFTLNNILEVADDIKPKKLRNKLIKGKTRAVCISEKEFIFTEIQFTETDLTKEAFLVYKKLAFRFYRKKGDMENYYVRIQGKKLFLKINDIDYINEWLPTWVEDYSSEEDFEASIMSPQEVLTQYKEDGYFL